MKLLKKLFQIIPLETIKTQTVSVKLANKAEESKRINTTWKIHSDKIIMIEENGNSTIFNVLGIRNDDLGGYGKFGDFGMKRYRVNKNDALRTNIYMITITNYNTNVILESKDSAFIYT